VISSLDFLLDAAAQKEDKAKLMTKVKKFLGITAPIHYQADKSGSIAMHVLQRLKEIECSLILVRHAVENAEADARAEYRMVRPPVYKCEVCERAFPDRSSMDAHKKNSKFEHEEDIPDRFDFMQKALHVDSIFVGEQGRTLRANRLFFSAELGSFASRFENAIKAPFRPNLADPGGKRYNQQLRGMFVQGIDAKSGVRANHRKNALLNQHAAAARRAPPSNSLIQVSMYVIRYDDAENNITSIRYAGLCCGYMPVYGF
jgi:hypothetical protein